MHDENRHVLANSAIIAPSKIKKHRKWMYMGPSGKVVLNPEPEDTDGENWEAVIGEMVGLANRQSLREHVRSLAAAFGDDEVKQAATADISWIRRLANYGEFSEADNAFLIDLSLIARAAAEADSTWHVLLLPDNDWKEQLNDDRNGMWRWPHWWW